MQVKFWRIQKIKSHDIIRWKAYSFMRQTISKMEAEGGQKYP
jgi:hypothetical protein